MIQWACTVEAVNETYTGDVEDLSERITARLGNQQASASFGRGRILASFIVDARLVLQATETALKVWNKAMDDGLAWSIVSVTARRTDQPDDLPGLPKLLGVAEVAMRLEQVGPSSGYYVAYGSVVRPFTRESGGSGRIPSLQTESKPAVGRTAGR
jgi:hypothetical protein